MLGEEDRECWTRTLDAEEVIHWPLVIWIWMTSLVFTGLVVGEGDGDEMQRAKGKVAGDEKWYPTCSK